MGVISKYHKLILPGKGTTARQMRAGAIRYKRKSQKSGQGPNVRATLIKNIGKKVGAIRKAEKTARLQKTSHKITMGASLKKRTARYAAMKAKSVVAGAGTGRKPRGKKAEALKTFTYST